MNIFHKRPLALILCVTVGGFAFSVFSSNALKIILLTLSLITLATTFINPGFKEKRLVRYASIGIIISVIFSYVYFELWFKAYKRYDDEAKIIATVEYADPISSYTTRLTLKCDNINETFLSGYKLVMYLPREESLLLSPGTVISFKADVNGFERSSTEQNYFSDGISAVAENITDLKLVDTKHFFLPEILSKAREHITRYITILTDAESGGLLSALLVGERDKLSPDTRLNFKRIGITHVLALSGIHLAILFLGLDKLLLILRVKKKPRILLSSAFIFLYMMLCGFPVSVQRAGIMLLLSSALFLVSKSRDSLTSLTVAVFLICLITPYSVYDIALWLSALATFGLILLGEYYSGREKAKNLPKRILSYIIVGVLSSFFAISATLFISQKVFGAVSIIGIISTLIFSVLIEIIMYLGSITMFIGPIIPIGKLLPPICRLTTELAAILASPDFVYVKNDFPLAEIVTIILTLLFVGLALFSIKRKRLYLSILAVVFMLAHVIPIFNHYKASTNEQINYYSTTKCDELLIKSSAESCYISSAQYSKNLGYHTLDILNEADATSLDGIYLTHYSYSIEDMISVVFSSVKVDSLYLPAPQNDQEQGMLNKLKIFVESYSTQIVLLDEYNCFKVGDYTMNAFSISTKNSTICYVSSGLLEGRISETIKNYIACSDTVILGTHGKKYKSHKYMEYISPRLNQLIINSTNLFLTQETMEEYVKNGCEVISHPSMVELLN